MMIIDLFAGNHRPDNCRPLDSVTEKPPKTRVFPGSHRKPVTLFLTGVTTPRPRGSHCEGRPRAPLAAVSRSPTGKVSGSGHSGGSPTCRSWCARRRRPALALAAWTPGSRRGLHALPVRAERHHRHRHAHDPEHQRSSSCISTIQSVWSSPPASRKTIRCLRASPSISCPSFSAQRASAWYA